MKYHTIDKKDMRSFPRKDILEQPKTLTKVCKSRETVTGKRGARAARPSPYGAYIKAQGGSPHGSRMAEED